MLTQSHKVSNQPAPQGKQSKEQYTHSRWLTMTYNN